MTIHETPLTEPVLARLISLSKDWEAENSCYGYRANQRADIEGNRIFLAEENGEAVGYLFGHAFRSENMRSVVPEGSPCFEVEELYVVPALRSRGIGKRLFQYAADAVRGEADYMVLRKKKKNWRAIFHFYLDDWAWNSGAPGSSKKSGTAVRDSPSDHGNGLPTGVKNGPMKTIRKVLR